MCFGPFHWACFGEISLCACFGKFHWACFSEISLCACFGKFHWAFFGESSLCACFGKCHWACFGESSLCACFGNLDLLGLNSANGFVPQSARCRSAVTMSFSSRSDFSKPSYKPDTRCS